MVGTAAEKMGRSHVQEACSFDKEFVFYFDEKPLEVLKRASSSSFEKILVAPVWRINPRRAQVATGAHGIG